jgi:arylsulfatase A-like enzyme
MSKISRRSFLKLAGATASTLLFPWESSGGKSAQQPGNASSPNIIIIVFDAMSATNLSLYGYARPTAPNLERFADRATVYRSHYAGGNYTIPGVSSLLTGTYPWTTRAINHGGYIIPSKVENNLFRAIGNDYYRLSFAQSVWAQFLLNQFDSDLEVSMPPGSFSEVDYILGNYLPNDRQMAAWALDDFIFKMEYAPASLVFGPIQRALFYRDSVRASTDGYPRGLPQNVNYPLYFRLEKVFDGLAALLPHLPSPSLSYIHLFPPHAPYRASERFYQEFVDTWKPIKKPTHRFSDGLANSILNTARRSYDEYIASVDWEFGRLLDALEQTGVFDNSYVVVTADHGEMFERGEKAHSTALLYEPIVHIPLIISAPGQTKHEDIYSPTSAVDLLPTLTHLTNKPVPAWCEGRVLPGLGGREEGERSLFVVEAKSSSAFRPLNKATVVLRKDNYKLIYYTGYEAENSFELYDIAADHEELEDLYPGQPAFARHMKDELLEALFAADKPFMKG